MYCAVGDDLSRRLKRALYHAARNDTGKAYRAPSSPTSLFPPPKPLSLSLPSTLLSAPTSTL